MSALAFCLFSGVLSYLIASPHPVLGSPSFLRQVKNSYYSDKGFYISAPNHPWQLKPGKSDQQSYIERLYLGEYQAQTGSRPQLSIRTENISETASFKEFLKQWTLEYPNYGFEVLSKKAARHQGHPVFLVDLRHPEQKKRQRQAVYRRGPTVVFLTCMDHEDTFSNNLSWCNQLMKGFHWHSTSKEGAQPTQEPL